MKTPSTHRTQPKLVETVGGWIACVVVLGATGALFLAIVAVLLGQAE